MERDKKQVDQMVGYALWRKYYTTNPQWITSILNKCDAIITLSSSWRQYYQSITNSSHIFIVENVVAPPILEQVTKKDNRFHLLYLGLITQQKGIFDLVETLHEHIDIFHDKIVLHIGGNGEVAALQEMISQYKLNDIVIYEGFVSGSQKADLLLNSNAFILPSYTEGLPVSILEAMSYGLPILTTPVGGIPEVVDSSNSILFTPGNKQEICKAISKFANSSNESSIQMRQSSKIKSKTYLPTNIADKLEKIYTDLKSPTA